MTPLPLNSAPLGRINRQVWLLALLPFAALVLVLLPYGRLLDWAYCLVYALGILLGWLLSRRYPLVGYGLYLLVGTAVAMAYARNPDTLPTRLGNAEEFYLAMLWPLVVGWSVLWGVQGAVASGLAGVLGTLSPTLAERLASGYGLAIAAAVGVAIHYLLKDAVRANERLAEAALQDPLTALGNRRVLETDFRRFYSLAERGKTPLLVTLWDLDGLKALNDSQGHAAGDISLKDFAGSLRLNVREGDGVYRIGGDEFAGLHLGLEDGRVMIARVRAVFPGVSVGWAQASENLEESLARADQSLYVEKNQRRASKN